MKEWHTYLCEYYKISPQQAITLGTRKYGRKPSLPGSPTTHEIEGMTLEDIWEICPRSSDESIHQFYKDCGAWFSIRQARHNATHYSKKHFDFISDYIKEGISICEYGAGIGPICWWIVQKFPNTKMNLSIVDVDSEHLTFGEYRLKRLIEDTKSLASIKKIIVPPSKFPLNDKYDLVTIIEVYEHLYNPLYITKHIHANLKKDGIFIENYCTGFSFSGCDLPVAQKERPLVYDFIKKNFELIRGNPDLDLPTETRSWKKL